MPEQQDILGEDTAAMIAALQRQGNGPVPLPRPNPLRIENELKDPGFPRSAYNFGVARPGAGSVILPIPWGADPGSQYTNKGLRGNVQPLDPVSTILQQLRAKGQVY